MDDKKKLEVLSNINRAAHFEWRRAVLALCPYLNPIDLIKKYWEEVAKDTAQYYLTKIDPDRGLAPQFAALFVSSSVVMGEDAELLEPTPEGHSRARHNDCPWYHWHQREDVLNEDQVGCDHWLGVTIEEINRALGRSLKFETETSLPAGGGCCLRRFWEEKI